MTKLMLDRRNLLVAAGGLVLFAGLDPASRAWGATKLEGYPFTLGVASGDPWPDGFVLWTRLAPKPLTEHGGMPMAVVPVRWEVAEDERFVTVVQSGEAPARPELGHSVHVEVAGLKPGRPYWYRFRVEGHDASPVGRVRTAPAAGTTPDRVRLAVAGCQALYHGWFTAWRHMSQEADLDAVFHYGDYIYEGGSDRGAGKYVVFDEAGKPVSRAHVGGELYSLDDYRRRYAQYKSDPDLQAAHASAAFISSFDDHEIDNNWAQAWDQDGTPPEVFALRKFVAMQAWYENMPVRRAQFPGMGGIMAYRRFDYGKLVRMNVLDTRTFRDDHACAREGQKNCRTGGGDKVSILGAQQEAWLHDGLSRDVRWNLIAQQVFVMPLKAKDAEGRVLPLFTDKWDGYVPSRQRLVRAIERKKLTNVVIASGDAHTNLIGVVPRRDDELDGPSVATEFLASSISSNGDGGAVTPAVQRFLDGGNPNLAMADDLRGYHTYDITPKEWRTDVKAMDQVQRPGGKIRTSASFTVEPDRPVLNRS